MINFVFIIVLCITRLDGLPYSQEERTISYYSSIKNPNYPTSLLSFKSSNYLTLDIPLVCTNVGRTGFRYYAPFKWDKLLTALKLESYIPLGDFKAVLSDV